MLSLRLIIKQCYRPQIVFFTLEECGLICKGNAQHIWVQIPKPKRAKNYQ